jgi:hypothetical protein
MCFGVKMKSDARFGLSEYAIEAGATPHIWQDKKPAYHYLEAHGLDASMAGHPLRTDWLNIADLERQVDQNQGSRTPLDSTTSDALGLAYRAYRVKVLDGSTNWQELRRNRGFHVDTKDLNLSETQYLTNEQLALIDETPAETTASFGFQTPTEETELYRQHLRDIISEFGNSGKQSFTPADIKAAGMVGRSGGWITQNLQRLVREGVISYNKESRFYSIVK